MTIMTLNRLQIQLPITDQLPVGMTKGITYILNSFVTHTLPDCQVNLNSVAVLGSRYDSHIRGEQSSWLDSRYRQPHCISRKSMSASHVRNKVSVVFSVICCRVRKRTYVERLELYFLVRVRTRTESRPDGLRACVTGLLVHVRLQV
jgi:hypothetical protein